MKRQKKKSRGILNKIAIALILIGLLIALLGYLDDLNHKIDFLIKYNHQQELTIDRLNHDVNTLRDVVVYQHEQIQDLQNIQPVTDQSPIIKINGEEIHNEVPNKEKLDLNIIDTPSIIVSTMVILGGMLKTLIPALP